MNVIERTFFYLGDASRWQGSDGITARLLEHLGITFFAVACAAALVVPLGLWAGHRRSRSRRWVANLLTTLVGASRALPALGLLTLVALWLGISIVPSLVVLVIIAAAPLLSGVLEGLASVPSLTAWRCATTRACWSPPCSWRFSPSSWMRSWASCSAGSPPRGSLLIVGRHEPDESEASYLLASHRSGCCRSARRDGSSQRLRAQR